MTPPFQIGDTVEVIGHGRYCISFSPHRFQIDQIEKYKGGIEYSAHIDPDWYPASSLRLVDELKIGDWVEVVGPDMFGSHHGGDIFQISNIWVEEHCYASEGYHWHPVSSLRKLTPDEIKQHLVPPINTPQNQFNEKVDRRLAAIEKRQGAQQNRQNEAREYSDNLYKITEKLAERICGLQKRLEFVEAFQKDAATHAAYMTYTYKPGEEGTITVHCSCGRKHEIEATPRAYGGDLHD